MTAFYSVLMPLGMIWAMISLFLVYWIDKYNLTRRSIVKSQLGKEYAQSVIEMLEYIIPIYGLSSIMCIHLTRGAYFANLEPLTIIGIIIGFINLYLPMQKYNEKLFHVKPSSATDVTFKNASLCMW